VVIGAGFAGLAAATALAEAGVRVQVFEARPGLGGRATAFRDPVTGERIDNGQHVLAGCYTETLAFLRRVGADRLLHRPSALRVPMIDQDGVRSVLALPPLPAPFHLLAGVLAWDALSFSDRLSVVRIGRALQNALSQQHAAQERRAMEESTDGVHGFSPAIDAATETVREWLTRHHQSPRLCRMLWEPLALAALNQSIDDATAPSFLAIIARMFGPEPDAATLLLPAVPLDDLYAHPARAYLESLGSTVSTSAPARLVIDRGEVVGVRVRNEFIESSLVIAAVPWFALADVCGEPPAELASIVRAAAALGSAPIVTVNLWFDEFELEEPLLGLPGRTFQWVFDKRRIVGLSQTHLSLVSSGADAICAAGNLALIETARRELGAAVPAAAAATVRHASVVRERRATFSLKSRGPARPGTRTPASGLLLAGDWIATGLPATIESAVASGHMAARTALAGGAMVSGVEGVLAGSGVLRGSFAP
jgi:uncharacterized protein with NAD-binding domain and iron-sulfur cluster